MHSGLRRLFIPDRAAHLWQDGQIAGNQAQDAGGDAENTGTGDMILREEAG